MTMHMQAMSARPQDEPEVGASNDAMWRAVQARTADASFLYGVNSTGIFCRSGCSSRTPKRENVAFFKDARQAREAGFRPCLKCRPEAETTVASDVVAEACRMIDSAETPPDLETLARRAGYSRFHFLRLFKAQTGVTPAAYARERRAARLRTALAEPGRVTDAIYDAGFNSSGRAYEAAPQSLGMSPSRYKARGQGESIRYAIGDCWLGKLLAAATDRGVCAILIGDDSEALEQDLRRRFGEAQIVQGGPEFSDTLKAVIALAEAPGRPSALPLDIKGTAFQAKVWQALGSIPAGATASYGEVAKAIGEPKAMRAVARACADNPLALAIPCHRVVRTDGGLSGYRWGPERKRAILEREAKREA